MTIRQARADDHWRRAFAREYEVRYEQLSFESLACFKNGTVTFRSGITAIVGGNGIGKSTLVAAVVDLLGEGLLSDYLNHQRRLIGSKLAGRIVENAVVRARSANEIAGGRTVGGDNIEAECRWLDPAYLAFQICEQISQDQNFGDLIEPLTSSKLAEDELETLSYLVGKRYESCEIFEIADYAEFERLPYFRATSHGVTYGSEFMGQGELSLLLIYWQLRDLRSNSILVLEELETHVSPRSQIAVMNTIARYCDEKGIWVILTTHSPVVTSRIPREHIRLLVRADNEVAILENAAKHQLAGILGGGEGFRGVLFVEDDVAKELVVSLLEEMDPDTLRQFEIVNARGGGGITAALKSFPRTRKWFSVIGAYDGDMRSQVNGRGLLWPHIFLPSDRSPEVLLHSIAHGRNGVELLHEQLRVPTDIIVAALNVAEGMNLHDWLLECSRRMGVNRESLVRVLVRIWLRDRDSFLLGEQFLRDLQSSYNADSQPTGSRQGRVEEFRKKEVIVGRLNLWTAKGLMNSLRKIWKR